MKLAARRLPPLNALRAFEAAARHQNFSRAGQELCVTPGAISRHIANLEGFVGAPLFARVNQHVVLTKAGSTYATHLHSIFDQLQEATRAQFGTAADRHCLRIAVPSTFALRYLIPRLAKFKERFPELELQVESSYFPADPTQDNIDIAIRLDRGACHGVVAKPLFDEEMLPVGSPALLAGRRIQDPNDIEPFPLLHAARREDDWQRWLNAVGASRVNGTRGLRLEYMGLVYQAAIEGLGLAMAQTTYIQPDLASRRLVPVMRKTLRTGRSYYMLHSEQNDRHPPVHRFREWLQAEVDKTSQAIVTAL